MALNPIIYMQVEISNLYMQKYNLSVKDFIALDKEYKILDFIAEGYEPFHLMGNQGILNEVHEYVEVQRNYEQRNAKTIR